MDANFIAIFIDLAVTAPTRQITQFNKSMEVLSVAASVVAVVGAAEKVTKGLHYLRELKEAQDDAESCCNEIAALRAICYQIDFIERQWQAKPSNER